MNLSGDRIKCQKVYTTAYILELLWTAMAAGRMSAVVHAQPAIAPAAIR